ncbi:hypothetical protein Golob_005272 [Gossypium lobatum]|uniref:Anaphase-promoting complex subunit 4 WD40 domain-containing protein n=1 Tax=Gossypium lobatum TaxID=34289 RepID=A0A7J8MSM9_9ROSI|nr:hypothetical protein [Gossypium lobatum]
MHSSVIRRFALEEELEGHQSCVNAIAWNSSGTLLISGSDDARINIWGYSGRKLLHSIETGHSANIFCTKFIPETSDELVVSGAGDAEVRLFNLSRLNGRGLHDGATTPSALYQCHTKRVKKLAVEVGNPNVVWSASEDGTLRQHDFREGTSCPPAGSSQQECRNVLVRLALHDNTYLFFHFNLLYSSMGSLFVELDLRCGAKRSLADPPKHTLALKSCDISSTRPHLLLVGGNDAFARLYDRRMLPPLTSCRKRMSPPTCVNYFCPMHLSDRGRSSLHLTHVTFSPNGEEVLLSYSGEHVYLMDINHGVVLHTAAVSKLQTYMFRELTLLFLFPFLPGPSRLHFHEEVLFSLQYKASGSVMQYSSGDVSELMTFTPVPNRREHQPSVSSFFENGLQKRSNTAARVEKCRMLVEIAKRSEERTNIFHAIEACNEVLDGNNGDIGPSLRHECLCTRAALLLQRKWKNDAHMAVRDCHDARRIDNSSFRAHYCMAEALEQLGKHKEALNFAVAAQCLSPFDTMVAEKVENLKTQLAVAEAEKNNKASDGSPKSEPRAGRVLSLSDILYRTEGNSDASQDGPRSDREDSDYDEELELDFETSISGDEGHDVESNMLHGSLNLRIHRRGDAIREAGPNGSCGSPSLSSQNKKSAYQVHICTFCLIFQMNRILISRCLLFSYVIIKISS